MKHLLMILLSAVYLPLSCQVTNYQITNSNNLANIAYKIYNANDGNILLSNGELNWDQGSGHLLKVKPNGDTIFIKSSNASDIFVTSTGNIIDNPKYFNILANSYTNSILTFYDKNYTKKWQIDLTNYSAQHPIPPVSNYIIYGCRVTSIFEKNSNHYIVFATTVIGTPYGSDYGKYVLNFDSLGNLLVINRFLQSGICYDEKSNNTHQLAIGLNPYNYGGNNYGGYNIYNFLTYKTTFIKHINTNTKLDYKDGVFLNNKLYITGTISNMNDTNQTYQKGFIMCVDTNTNINWFKTIIPTDSTINNEITGIKPINNNLICKYNSGDNNYVLNFDTLGTMTQSNHIPNNLRITNFIYSNNNIYTSASDKSNYDISLIKLNPNGSFLCSNASNLNVVDFHNDSIYTYIRNGQSDVYPTSIFTNSVYASLNYTVNISSGCSLTTDIDEKSIKENNYEILPNPNNGLFEVVNSNLSEFKNTFIKIYNSLGLEIKTIEQQQQNTPVDISTLCSGVYYVSIIRDKRVIETKKLIKQ